jgi:hypothetical protein
MSRPFRASRSFVYYAGRCPGLVCPALSGLPPARGHVLHPCASSAHRGDRGLQSAYGANGKVAWPCSCGLAVCPCGFFSTQSARGGDAASTSQAPPFTAGIRQTTLLPRHYIPPLQGSSVFASLPRALPWAGISRPFRAFISSYTGCSSHRTRRSAATRMIRQSRARHRKKPRRGGLTIARGKRSAAPGHVLDDHVA